MPLLAALAAACDPVGTAASGRPTIARETDRFAAQGWTGANARLADAAARGDADGVARAVADGADPNARAASGMPILMTAAMAGSEAGFAALLDAGADPNARFPYDRTKPEETGHVAELMVAEDRLPYLAMLLEAGADPNAKAGGNEPLIWHAALNRGWPALRMLVEAGADVDAFNHDAYGDTVLRFYAAGAFDKALWLLERGARPDHPLRQATRPELIGTYPVLEDIFHYPVNATAFPELAEAQAKAQRFVLAEGYDKPPIPKRHSR